MSADLHTVPGSGAALNQMWANEDYGGSWGILWCSFSKSNEWNDGTFILSSYPLPAPSSVQGERQTLVNLCGI